MAEYIEKAQIVDWYRSYGEKDKPIPFETLVVDLRSMKAADVAPVVHGRWISVEERLPEEWKDNTGELINYEVFMPEYGVDIGNYAAPAKKWLCLGIPVKVTHWMPMPKPPEVEI